MRLIYVDEAGTAAHEPVTVVCGIIVDPDKQWAQAAALVKEAYDTVPTPHREGFVFHATSIWGSQKYRDNWSREQRTQLLKRMMMIPFLCGIGIVYAVVSRKAPPIIKANNLTKEKLDHVGAFGLCVGMADLGIRERGKLNEIAVVVAEDNDLKKELRDGVGVLTRTAFDIDALRASNYTVNSNSGGTDSFRLMADHNKIRVTRIVDTIHFVKKSESLILGLADACAFGLRRYFSKQSSGEGFIRAIYGGEYADPKTCGIPPPLAEGGVGLCLLLKELAQDPSKTVFHYPSIRIERES